MPLRDFIDVMVIIVGWLLAVWFGIGQDDDRDAIKWRL